ncbi:MAG TPA: hypothetical protein VHV82_16630 [Sporichthyaceae bacterium]|jgi:hypothetical protein|nr:hypothetical protein [Sporichthyaceae bacterium]
MAGSDSESEAYELDLFTVLTALGSGRHRDLTPISDEAQYTLANALAQDAVTQRWPFAGISTQDLYDAVRRSRTEVASPMALVPVAVAEPDVLVELGVDAAGPTTVVGLIESGAAIEVLPGLLLLAYTGLGARRRDGTRSVTIALPRRK